MSVHDRAGTPCERSYLTNWSRGCTCLLVAALPLLRSSNIIADPFRRLSPEPPSTQVRPSPPLEQWSPRVCIPDLRHGDTHRADCSAPADVPIAHSHLQRAVDSSTIMTSSAHGGLVAISMPRTPVCMQIPPMDKAESQHAQLLSACCSGYTLPAGVPPTGRETQFAPCSG